MIRSSTRSPSTRPLLFLAFLGCSGWALGQSAARLQAISLVKEAAAIFARGDMPLVIKVCQQALSLDPTYPRAHTYLGAAYQKRGERQNACAAYQRVIQLAPRTPDATRASRGIRELGCNVARPNSLRPTLPPPVFRPNLRLETRWSATAGIGALAWSPDASQISGGGTDGAWRLWRAKDGRLDRLERGDGYVATATAMGPQTAVGYGNGSLRFFDAVAGRESNRLGARSGNVAGLQYSPDGAVLAVAGRDGALQILDGRTAAVRHSIPGAGLVVSGAAFSPDGRLVAAGVGSEVRIYEAQNGRLVRALPGDGLPIAALAWSRNGLLAAASGYRIRVWNGATGRLQQTLKGHRLAVSALSFGAGSTLASGGYDAQLRLWNAATGASAAFALHNAPIRALDFDLTGKKLVSGDDNGLVGMWRLD